MKGTAVKNTQEIKLEIDCRKKRNEMLGNSKKREKPETEKRKLEHKERKPRRKKIVKTFKKEL